MTGYKSTIIRNARPHQRCEVGGDHWAALRERGSQTRCSTEASVRNRGRANSEPRNIATPRPRGVMPKSSNILTYICMWISTFSLLFGVGSYRAVINKVLKRRRSADRFSHPGVIDGELVIANQCEHIKVSNLWMCSGVNRGTLFSVIGILSICLFMNIGVSGQVQVSMTIPNLGSPYLSEYVGNASNQVLVLSNTSGQTQQVMLRGQIEQLSSPGYFLRTKENYRPVAPITLMPFETRTFFANPNDFAFLSESNLENNVPSSIQRQIQATGILPEGEYQICVQAFDFNTRQPLSGEAPIGCQFFFVTLGTPPQLIQPMCGDTISDLYPMMSWLPATSMVPLMNIQYDLYIVEHFSRALNPMEVMEQAINYGGGNPIIIRDLRSNTYMYSPGDIPLREGRNYIVCVVARNDRNSAIFENRGRSEICMFHIRRTMPIVFDPVIVNVPEPSINPAITLIPSNDLVLNVNRATVRGKLTHRFRDQQLNGVESVMALEEIMPEVGMTNFDVLTLPPGQTEFDPSTYPGQPGLNPLTLPPGQTGINPLTYPGQANNSSLQSQVVSIEPTLMSGGQSMSQVASYTSHLSTVTHIDGGDYQYNNNGMFFDHNPYRNGSLPLPFTNVSLVEEYYGTVVDFPTQLSDFVRLDRHRPLNFSLPFSLNSRILATTITNSKGEFNFGVSIDRPCGVVIAGGLLNNLEVRPIQIGDLNPEVYNKAYRKIYRIIRIIVQDKRYYSPDVMLFLQPGGQLDVGTQTALIHSYKMKVNVKASGGGTFADKSAPIAIKIMRRKTDRIQQGTRHPAFEPASPDGNADQASYGDYWVYYTTYTDGVSFEIRNMVKHLNSTTSLYYMELSTDINKKYNFKTKVVPFTISSSSSDYPSQIWGSRNYFNSNYNEGTVHLTVELEAELPEIYLQAMYDGSHSGVASEPLPNVRVRMHYGITGWNPTNVGHTNSSGKIRWRLPASFMSGRDALPIRLECSHPGYATQMLPQSGTFDLKYGMRYPASEVRMRPRARVTLEVRDEDNKPIAAMVKIGDAPAVETVRKCIGEDLDLNDLLRSNDLTGALASGQSLNEILYSYVPAAFSQSFQANQQQSSAGTSNLNNTVSIGSSPGGIDNQINPNFNGNFTFEPNGLPDLSFNANANTSTDKTPRCRYFIENYPVPSGDDVELLIMPFATVYDTLRTTVNIRPGASLLDLGIFKVKFKRKKKYIELVTDYRCGQWITPDNNTNPVQICPTLDVPTRVTLHTVTRTTNRLPDILYFEFPNNATSFRLKVDAGPNYIPINTFVTVTDYADTLRVVIEEGAVKKGRVIDKVTRQPIPEARVYFQNGTDTYAPHYVETFTDQNGFFELRGIDTYNSPTGVILVSKTNSTVTYSGATLSLYPLEVEPTIELELLDWDIHRILGFSVELSKVVRIPDQPDELFISGIVTRMPSSPNFRPEQGVQIKIPFKDLRVRKVLSNSIGERPKVTAVADHFDLEITTMPILVNGAFLGLMRPPGDLDKVRIMKMDNHSGSINGNVEIRLSSFNFENHFNGIFYISRDSNALNMWVFRSNPSSSNLIDSEFYVGKKVGNQLQSVDYTVEGFPAISYKSDSRLKRDTFHLPTTLQIALPEMIPAQLDIEVGTIKVTKNQLLVRYSGNSLNFKLEEWQVRCNSWYFNQSESSIIIPSADIITQSLQVKVSNLRLRHNQPPLNTGELQINQGVATLSGVVPLQFVPGAKLHLRYYENIYSNEKKRYALQIEAPVGEQVACRANLPNILTNGTLDLWYYHIYSNNVAYIGMKPSQELVFYQVLPIKGAKIELYPDLFEISGTTHLNVPGLNTGAVSILRFTKPNQQINTELIGMSIQLNNMNGQVYYKSDTLSTRFELVYGRLSAYGDLWVMEGQQERFRLRSLFELTPSTCTISTFDCVPGTQMPGPGAQRQLIWLNEDRNPNSEHLQVVSGNMHVQANQWRNFIFRGRMSGSGSSKGIKEGENELDFIVEGAIVALGGQKLGVNNMETPSSGSNGFTFNTYFNFEKGALYGDWSFNLPAPLVIGTLTIEGTVQGGFKFAPEGFYFYQDIGTARVHPIPGTFKMLFIVGSTSIENIDTEAKAILKNTWRQWDDFPPSLARLDGFFMGGNYSLFDVDFNVNLFIVGIGVEIRAGADVYAALTFGNIVESSFGVGIYVGVKVDAHVLFCSACAAASASVGLCGVIGSNQMRIEGKGSVSVSGSLSCGPSFSHTISMEASLSNNDGLKVSLGSSSGPNPNSCLPGPTDPIVTCGT